jgi:hypothetical protein
MRTIAQFKADIADVVRERIEQIIGGKTFRQLCKRSGSKVHEIVGNIFELHAVYVEMSETSDSEGLYYRVKVTACFEKSHWGDPITCDIIELEFDDIESRDYIKDLICCYIGPADICKSLDISGFVSKKFVFTY